MPWRPTEPGEAPTLGWEALDWMGAMLARPEVPDFEPFSATQEQADFLLEFYRIDPTTGTRLRRRGVISRPRGWGKSPFTAAIAAFEALGPALFAGWDAEGQPVGMPWSETRRPLVEIAAVSEDQVSTNTWAPLKEILDGPAVDEYGLEILESFIAIPGGGKIQKRTAEAKSAKGAPAHFVVCDQTEEWVSSNGGVSLFNTLRNNVIKRGGHILESPNAFTPGLGSVAEKSMAAYVAIREGRARLDDGVIFDHREAPAETDLTDRDSLLIGLRVAYGDSADVEKCAIHEPPCVRPGWVNLDHIAASIWDPDADEQLSRSDWLNQITHASDSWLSAPEWAACASPSTVIADRDMITLGFDGSRGRAKGKPDATALVACRLEDGHLWDIAVWESMDQNEWPTWQPPIVEIEAALRSTFARYNVVGLYADPAKDWRSHVNAWEAEFGSRVTVKARRDHPFEWWMTSGRSGEVQRAIEAMEGAVRNRDLTHSGSHDLTRHVLNARRRLSHGKLALAKANDYSPNKIDAAAAAVLAWQARLDAIAAGAMNTKKRTGRVRRVGS